MRELTELRGECFKHYDLEDGKGTQRLVAKAGPIHYKDGRGDWQDVSTRIENGRVDKCAYSMELLVDKVGYKGVDPKGKEVELELTGVSYKAPAIVGNRATWEEIEKDVNFYIEFTPKSIRVKRVLKTQSANKTAVFRSLREEGAAGKVVHLGIDGEGKKTKLIITEQPTGVTNEKRITQIFDNKVMKMDKATRKRKWSADVVYPVIIDPTSTFEIAANVDDGYAFGRAPLATPSPWTTTGRSPATYYGRIFWVYDTSVAAHIKTGNWLRFALSGIPQSSVISTATMKMYGGSMYASTQFIVQASDSGNPPNPTAGADVVSPLNTVGQTQLPAFTAPITNKTNKGQYSLLEVNVQNMVQSLVNSYSYEGASYMLFFLNAYSSGTYLIATAPGNIVYQRNWGTSKDAELVIEYSFPVATANLVSRVAVYVKGTSSLVSRLVVYKESLVSLVSRAVVRQEASAVLVSRVVVLKEIVSNLLCNIVVTEVTSAARFELDSYVTSMISMDSKPIKRNA